MKRIIKKQIWLSLKEAEILRRKAENACMHEAGLIRKLIMGYEPRAFPEEAYFVLMEDIRHLTNSIEELSLKTGCVSEVEKEMLEAEVKKWHEFQAKMEMCFLADVKSDMPWQ